jgi:hypothetical protein
MQNRIKSPAIEAGRETIAIWPNRNAKKMFRLEDWAAVFCGVTLGFLAVVIMSKLIAMTCEGVQGGAL